VEEALSETGDESVVEGIAIPASADEIVESEAPPDAAPASDIGDLLREMDKIYRADPMLAVRGQAFIKLLHGYIADQLDARLTRFSRRRGIKVVKEATILGSTKPKDEDVAVVDPENGPLLLVGVRSQMSSVGKNALNYYEMLVGECTSLQEWFPMTTHGYVYLHPLQSIKVGKEDESIDHKRYARMYAAATGRDKREYKNQRGRFDQFAYMVVDFGQSPPIVRDDIVQASVPDLDMTIDTFVDRLVGTFKERLILWDVFD
jgi:hypothetical protein